MRKVMILSLAKKCLLVSVFLFGSLCHGQDYFPFAAAVFFETNTDACDIRDLFANTDNHLISGAPGNEFQNANLGSFTAFSGDLLLKGAEIKIGQPGGVTDFKMFYNIEQLASPVGAFTESPNLNSRIETCTGSTFSDGLGDCSNVDEKWTNLGTNCSDGSLAIDMTQFCTPGTYKLTVFLTLEGNLGTQFISNFSNNFTIFFDIVAAPALQISSTQVGNDTCDLSVGQIDVEVTGGAGSLMYQWSNDSTSQDISGLDSGEYKLVVTDMCGNQDSVTVSVNEVPCNIDFEAVATCTGVNGFDSIHIDFQNINYNGAPGNVSFEVGGLSLLSQPTSSSSGTSNQAVDVTDGLPITIRALVDGVTIDSVQILPVLCNYSTTDYFFCDTQNNIVGPAILTQGSPIPSTDTIAYRLEYILVGEDGVIDSINQTGLFTNVNDGEAYTIYLYSYEEQISSDFTIGTPFVAPTNDTCRSSCGMVMVTPECCFAEAGSILGDVMTCEFSPDLHFVVNKSGDNIDSEYAYLFLRVNNSGVIVEANSTGNFDLSSEDVSTTTVYQIYGLNYRVLDLTNGSIILGGTVASDSSDFVGKLLSEVRTSSMPDYNATIPEFCGDTSNAIFITISPTDTSSFSVDTCSISYEWDGTVYNTSGEYLDTFVNDLGCDSIVTLRLTLRDTSSSMLRDSICAGDTLPFGGELLTMAGVYRDTLLNSVGCDSIVTLTLEVLDTSSFSYMDSICVGDTLPFGGELLTMAGVYQDTLMNSVGCDSVVWLTLEVLDTSSFSYMDSICAGDTLPFGGELLTMAGVYQDTLLNSVGCDSIVTLTLEVLDTSSFSYMDNICVGDTLPFGGELLTMAGVYQDTLMNSVGCDSIVTLTLEVLDTSSFSYMDSICAGDTLPFGGEMLTMAGVYQDTLMNSVGCDSIVTLTLEVLDTSSFSYMDSICAGDTLSFGGELLTMAGVYQDTLLNSVGCDSIVTLTLEVLDTSSFSYMDSICAGDTLPFGGELLTMAGVYQDTLLNSVGCDSIVTLTLEVLDTSSFSYMDSICAGDTLPFGGELLTMAGVYQDTLMNSVGCDSIVTLTLEVLDTSSFSYMDSICVGDTLPFGGELLTMAGVYQDTLMNSVGCDSIVTLTLEVLDTSSFSYMDSICAGDTLPFGGEMLTMAGVYQDTLMNSVGCDSIVTLTLEVLDTSSFSYMDSICAGDTLLFGGDLLTMAGVYQDTLLNSVGCDSIVTLTLEVLDTSSFSYMDSICAGDTLPFGGELLTMAGVYQDTLMNSVGCDSIVTLTLEVLDTSSFSYMDSICAGDTLLFGGELLTMAGVYQDTLLNSVGCDSIVTLTLEVLDTSSFGYMVSICAGDTLPFGGELLTMAGVYQDRLMNSVGCDSIVTLTLEVLDTSSFSYMDSICAGDTLPFGGELLTMAGVYRDTLMNSVGCDSIVTLTLEVLDTSSFGYMDSICAGDTLPFGGEMLTMAGVYQDTLMNSVGCDSIVTLTLEVLDTSSFSYMDSICAGDTLPFGGELLTMAGVYQDTLMNSVGCDSIVTLTLDVLDTSSFSYMDSICAGDTLPFGGELLTMAGVYQDTLMNSVGCDSIVTLTLEVLDTSSFSYMDSICSGDTLPFGGELLTMAGVYQDTLLNSVGCDSIVTLTLEVLDTSSFSYMDSICAGDTLPFGGELLTMAGVYQDTLLNSVGCDSIVTLTLEVLDTSSFSYMDSICAGDTLPFGGELLTMAGVYQDTLLNSVGCDSIVTLTLEVLDTNSFSYMESICSGDTLLFGGEMLTMAGVYQDTLLNSVGCDSIVTLTLEVLDTSSFSYMDSICAGDTLMFGGEMLTMAGVYQDTLMNSVGCDSIVTLTLEVLDTRSFSYMDSICAGDTLPFGGELLTMAGVYQDTLLNSVGCDSIVTLTLEVLDTSSFSYMDSICAGDTLLFGGELLTMAGVYQDTLMNSVGCDSIVTLTLEVLDTSSFSYMESICSGDTLLFGGELLTMAGVYQDTLLNSVGCDSIVTLTLEVLDTSSFSYIVTICPEDTFIFGSEALTIAGVYQDTLMNSVGCDSVVTLTLSVIDTIPPTINCPADITIANCALNPDTSLTGAPTVSDNCTMDSIWYSDVRSDNDCINDTIYRSWFARDIAGNMDTCVQVIIQSFEINLSIDDPCNCADPLNYSMGDMYFFHDIAVVTSDSSGLLITLDADSLINVFDSNGSIITSDDVFTEVSPGIYHLDFWVKRDSTFTLFANTSIGRSLVLSGICTEDCSSRPPNCLTNINISCGNEVSLQDVLAFDVAGIENFYSLELRDFSGSIVSNPLPSDFSGQVTAIVTHNITAQSCESTVEVSDKRTCFVQHTLDTVVWCIDDLLAVDPDGSYYDDILGLRPFAVEHCTNDTFDVSYSGEWMTTYECGDTLQLIVREWRAETKDGNSCVANDSIYVIRLPNLYDYLHAPAKDTIGCTLDTTYDYAYSYSYVSWKQLVGIHSDGTVIKYPLDHDYYRDIREIHEEWESITNQALKDSIEMLLELEPLVRRPISAGEFVEYDLFDIYSDLTGLFISDTIDGQAYKCFSVRMGDQILTNGGAYLTVDENWFFEKYDHAFWVDLSLPSVNVELTEMVCDKWLTQTINRDGVDIACEGVQVVLPNHPYSPDTCHVYCLDELASLNSCIEVVHIENKDLGGSCPRVVKRHTLIKQACVAANVADLTSLTSTCPNDVDASGIVDTTAYGSGYTMEIEQWLIYIDTLAPVLSPFEEKHVQFNTSSHDCYAEVVLPSIAVKDVCSGVKSIKASLENAEGWILYEDEDGDGEWEPIEGRTLQVACSPDALRVQYEIMDSCHNVETIDTNWVSVIDRVSPMLNLNDTLTLTLGGKDSWLNVEVFDHGSQDNCAVVKQLIRRADWTTACAVNLCPTDGSLTNVNTIAQFEAYISQNGIIGGLSDNEVESYYASQYEWLLEDGQWCNGTGHIDLKNLLIQGWRSDVIKAWAAEGCLPTDEHANPLIDVEEEAFSLGGGWGDEVPFCCEDVCKSITIEVLTIDKSCNYTKGWVVINVEDNSTVRQACEFEEITIGCSSYQQFYAETVMAAGSGNEAALNALDNLFGPLVKGWEPEGGAMGEVIVDIDGNEIAKTQTYYSSSCRMESVERTILDTLHDGTVIWKTVTEAKAVEYFDTLEADLGGIYMQCSAHCIPSVWVELNDCGVGKITRRWEVYGGCGTNDIHNTTPLIMEQVIHVTSDCELNQYSVSLPNDTLICGELNYDLTGNVDIDGGQLTYLIGDTLCRQLGIGHQDQVFRVLGEPNIYKIHRTWTATDWCNNQSVELVQKIILDTDCDQASVAEVENDLAREASSEVGGRFELYQNAPNPFVDASVIQFKLPDGGAARLTLFDVSGKVLYELDRQWTAGIHEVLVKREMLGKESVSGIVFYQLETAKHSATKQMIILR